jgi:hypothetical protein
MNYTISDMADISKQATNKIAADFQKFGWNNPPTVSIAMVEAVLEVAQQGVHPTGLTSRQKEEVRQMIQSALDTGSA